MCVYILIRVPLFLASATDARILIEFLWYNIIPRLMNFRILPMTLLEFRRKGSNKLASLLLCPLRDQTPVSDPATHLLAPFFR